MNRARSHRDQFQADLESLFTDEAEHDLALVLEDDRRRQRARETATVRINGAK